MDQIVTERLSARERLLAAADELFYAEGIHTVGIDRIIERAGVAKATLYTTFGSKDELVRCYLQSRYETRRARLLAGIQPFDDPRDQLLALFDVLRESLARPSYRGCAFVNASAESPAESVPDQVSREYRTWLRGLFRDLASKAGAEDPDGLAEHFVLLYDGAAVGARMDRNPDAGENAKAMAEVLLEKAIARR
jgi:AcrR family transcriptional regulator